MNAENLSFVFLMHLPIAVTVPLHFKNKYKFINSKCVNQNEKKLIKSGTCQMNVVSDLIFVQGLSSLAQVVGYNVHWLQTLDYTEPLKSKQKLVARGL